MKKTLQDKAKDNFCFDIKLIKDLSTVIHKMSLAIKDMKSIIKDRGAARTTSLPEFIGQHIL